MNKGTPCDSFITSLQRVMRLASDDLASSELSEDEFNSLAVELFQLQFAFNAPYQNFCRKRGIMPADIVNWRDIPAIPAVAFKELELTSLPSHDRTTVFHSSGTTEHRPSRHQHNQQSIAIHEASLWS